MDKLVKEQLDATDQLIDAILTEIKAIVPEGHPYLQHSFRQFLSAAFTAGVAYGLGAPESTLKHCVSAGAISAALTKRLKEG